MSLTQKQKDMIREAATGGPRTFTESAQSIESEFDQIEKQQGALIAELHRTRSQLLDVQLRASFLLAAMKRVAFWAGECGLPGLAQYALDTIEAGERGGSRSQC